MLNVILRPILIVAAVIAGWFVARDAVDFNIVRMVVGLLLVTALVAVAACGELLADWFKKKKLHR